MGRVIWKYKLTMEPEQTLTLPLVEVLSVQAQGEELYLWALVNPDVAAKRTIQVLLCVTGGPLSSLVLYGRFLGTVQLADGKFVLHVFVRTTAGV